MMYDMVEILRTITAATLLGTILAAAYMAGSSLMFMLG